MNYQIWIVKTLMQKYENSKWFTDGESKRKIALRMQDESEVAIRMDIAEEKEQFLLLCTH